MKLNFLHNIIQIVFFSLQIIIIQTASVLNINCYFGSWWFEINWLNVDLFIIWTFKGDVHGCLYVSKSITFQSMYSCHQVILMRCLISAGGFDFDFDFMRYLISLSLSLSFVGILTSYLISAGGEFDFPLICLKALDCELRELSILQNCVSWFLLFFYCFNFYCFFFPLIFL